MLLRLYIYIYMYIYIYKLYIYKLYIYIYIYIYINIASKALPSHTTIASEFYSTYPQDAVQALCLPPTTLNLLMNAFVHPYLVLYVIFISRIIFFLLITYILIFIIRAECTHTGSRYYTQDICIVFFNQIFYIYFYNLFNFCYLTLISLRQSHHCFDCIICIVLFIYFFIVFYVYIWTTSCLK